MCVSAYLVLRATWDTFAFSKHIAANRSKAGSALASGGEAKPRVANIAAMAADAPAAHSASCSNGPTHQIDRMRATHARAVGEPSLAISGEVIKKKVKITCLSVRAL